MGDFPADKGQTCKEYQCVKSNVFNSKECPSGEVQRCKEFTGTGNDGD